MGFLSQLILSRDSLGHAHSLKYQGSDKYNTYVGAVISIAISILVLVFLTQKVTSLISMSEPTIEFHERLLYEDDVSTFG